MRKTTANQRVCRAVKKGILPLARTLKCTDCRNNARDYDHYRGYEDKYALIVQPVCRSCHIKREFKRGERYVSIETRRKLSESAKINNPMRSTSTRRKVSIALSGRTMPLWHRKKISISNMGKQHRPPKGVVK